ncbi:ankyrin repeat domain-containing protein [Chitinophaga filiformis]|uniref:ankyrin repeat domain-containing protein n=1 Tax=Chitinophaga filiformis TaxID=104663 RepID=UPI001F304901|nr:ankyrin repeat domain-containing protein [Chitinophaga filiformis]MCF6405473.1 ankyrin repeat domain-containing protein [Chitinophaga filiformis]
MQLQQLETLKLPAMPSKDKAPQPVKITTPIASSGLTSSGASRPAVHPYQKKTIEPEEPEDNIAQTSPAAITINTAAVIQRKEPWDSLAKKKWESKIKTIISYAQDIGNYDIEESDIITFLRDELNIEPPNQLNLQNESEYGKYYRELEEANSVKAIRFATAAHQQREWLNYEVDDSRSSSDSDDRYYSSEEDETPEGKLEFDRIISVITALNDLLDEYISELAPNETFSKIALSVIKEIGKYKQTDAYRKEKKFPNSFNNVSIVGMEDWLSFAHEFKNAKSSGGKQKPTVYNIEFGIWDEAQSTEIQFRGRQLKDAEGGPGRSWPAIALSLHQLAADLGAHLLEASSQETQTERGTQILAAAMLAILSGRGNEVYATIQEYKIDQDIIHRFESILLEFFALTMGIENIRLEFTQLDTILHLNNIARGSTMGQTNKKYNFLNVFSSVRETDTGELVHVYDRARYRWRRRRDSDDYQQLNEFEIAEQIQDTENDLEITKELTEYNGHKTASVEESEDRPSERGSIKSSKSVGKSMYSHSAGHNKTENLLFGVQKEIEKLWTQVRPVHIDEDKRELHRERLFSMGPIRLYNLFANLISRHGEELGELSPQQIAAWIMELYINFVEGTIPGSDNPFHDEIEVISGSDFGATVLKILSGEDGHKPDEAVVNILKNGLLGDKDALQTIGTIDKLKLRIALIELLRSPEIQGADLLHLAVISNSVALIELLLSIGVNLDGEDDQGRTALALALELHGTGEKNEEVINLLVGVQNKQTRKKKIQLPRDWAKYARFTDLDEDWLTDAEVEAGLNNATLPNTHIIPAVNITDNPDVLAEVIRSNYLHQMDSGAVEENTVVPINFNNAHWATLVIRQNPDRRSAPMVYFFDSMGQDEKKIALIKLMLRMTGVYTRVDNIVDLSDDLQEDGYTCGTWMIESASKIVTILENGGSVQDLHDSLSVIGAVVEELHKQNLKLAKNSPGEKSRTESSMELVIEDHTYHTFGNGMQEYSELWIEENYHEFLDVPSSLLELSQSLMINFEDVDEKMQKIYMVYIYKIYQELTKTEELADLFEEERQEIAKFLKANK